MYLQERINRLADEVGKRLEIQTQEIQSSLHKDKTFGSIEPVARDSLFSTSNRKVQPNITSQSNNPLSAASMRAPIPSITASTKKLPTFPSEDPWQSFDVQAAAAKAMERTQFVIDDAGDGEDEEDDDEELENGTDVDGGHSLLDEVDSFLSQADEVDGISV